jgi:hypothetical protein
VRRGSVMVRRGSVWCGVAQHGAAWLSMVRRGSAWCPWLSYGAAWLSMVRRGSVWCGVAQYGAPWLSYGAAWLSHGAAWLSMVRCGSVMVWRGSVDSASACCRAGPSSNLGSAPQGGFPTELTSDEEMERDTGKWRRINGLYECDCDFVNILVTPPPPPTHIS